MDGRPNVLMICVDEMRAGHMGCAYGPYLRWLTARGGSPAMLTAGAAREKPSGARPERVVIENDSPGMGYQVRCLVTPTHRLSLYPGTPDGELFDLVSDPHELENLWRSERHAALRQELIAALLDEYSRATPAYPVACHA
jgi:hypothetical protein